MAVFIIGDLHLSLGCEKPMDVFQGWQDYVPRLEKNWRALVAPQDTVVLAGDTSWGMKLEESLEDFRFLEALPGRKVLLKGNHDYWWTTAAKMAAFFEANGLRSFLVLHNQSVLCEDEHIALCGTRGWLAGQPDAHSGKVYAREVGRACGCAALPARLWGRQRAGDAGRAGAVRGKAVLLRPSACGLYPPGGAGKHRRGGIPPYQRRCAAILPL